MMGDAGMRFNAMKPLWTKQEVVESVVAHCQTLRGFGVSRLGVFGSFLREEVHEGSDVDLLVVFAPEQKTFRNFMDLCFFLEDLFGRRVDLLTPESLSPHFGHKILAEVEYVPLS